LGVLEEVVTQRGNVGIIYLLIGHCCDSLPVSTRRLCNMLPFLNDHLF
jgi:hypothetical protein